MTSRTLLTPGIRVAVLVAAFTVLVAPPPARAASAVDIQARALLGGRYEVGGWLALSVSLGNSGEPTSGDLVAETSLGSVRRFVEMPAGAQKVVMLYVQPEAFQREVTVTYDEPNGQVTARVDVRVFEQSNDQVIVIGDGTGALRPQLIDGGGDVESPEPIALGPADIPERPEPLGGISAIVWAGDSTSLNEAQRRAIERWVGDGGQLVVIGGGDWQSRTDAFTDLLPLANLAGFDDVPQDALAAWAGETEAPLATATVATGDLRDGALGLITAEDGEVLASMRSIGAGRVILLGTDFATEAFRGWAGAPSVWSRLLPTNAALEQWFGGDFPIRQEMENAMSGALSTVPALEVPPAELLLAVIVAYILLIGPISYYVLRRVDRRELAWVTAPLLVVLFSACSYGIGRTLKGGDVLVNEISVIRTASEGGSATVDAFAGIVSPDRTTYDLTVEADALIGQLMRQDGLPRQSGDVRVEQGEPAHLRGLTIPVFGFEAVRATGIVDYEPGLSVAWASRDGQVVGTVTNTSDVAIDDVAYISMVGGERIGDLVPGASAEFTLPGANFNGSSAADQVYGFGGFETGDEEQRLVTLRRQVIDSLVGYASFGPISVDVGRRGPFVIGWRDEPGPMAVALDGLQADAYRTSVEVLSVRPGLATGEVTIGPHQMGIQVVETDGDATAAGGGMMTLGEGSATWGISLPVEAAGIVPSEVEIIVGPDPSIVLSDPGGFGGFWPEGFIVEVRDPATGEWTELGDLSRQNRFEIDDPSTVLGATGRIVVRVTGVPSNPNLGQGSVFPSARVTGVLDR
jgi:hypothetical protein